MSDAFIVQKGLTFLGLVGPFKYAAWSYSPDNATPLARSEARQWAEAYGGVPVAVEIRTRVEPEAVATFSPPTQPSPFETPVGLSPFAAYAYAEEM